MTKMGTSGARLSAFRSAFGVLICASTIRFWWNGWIEEIYIDPTFHFGFIDGFTPWSSPWIYLHFLVIFAAGLCITIGLASRMSAATLLVFFGCVELWEKAAYLNHYYLVSLIALWLIFVPAQGYFSVRPKSNEKSIDARFYTALKIQISVVYFFAGFAKLNHDWLVHGEPLATWLSGYAYLSPIAIPVLAVAMSWGGALFDLSIWVFMWNQKTRRVAFVVACLFHAIVGFLFPIGVFPFVMVLCLTLFFSPSLRWGEQTRGRVVEARQWEVGAIAVILVLQFLIPLRFLVGSGDPNWTNDGFRFAWRVMLVEKRAHARFTVVTPEKRITVFPRDELRDFQYHQMSFQPDMIHQYAKALRIRFEEQGEAVVRVEADVRLSFNGRKSVSYLRDSDASKSVRVIAQPECDQHGVR